MLKGVILAAGKGSRLYPITHHIAKPLLPMVNRITMFYAFDRLKELGVTEICVVVGENEPQMRETLGSATSLGVNLTFVRQSEPQGLAHAVGFAKDFVGDDSFVLYLGDAIYSEGAQAAAELFRSTNAANVNLVKEVEDPRRYGVANLDGDKIVKLVEKPQNPESNWAMAGMYFFGPQLWTVLPELKPSARGEYEITDAIQMLIDQGETVLAGKYTGTWFDTGTLDSYLETSFFLSKGESVIDASAKVGGQIGDKVIIGANANVNCKSITNSVILPGAQIDGDAEIEGAFLGGTATLHGSVKDVILYDGQGV